MSERGWRKNSFVCPHSAVMFQGDEHCYTCARMPFLRPGGELCEVPAFLSGGNDGDAAAGGGAGSGGDGGGYWIRHWNFDRAPTARGRHGVRRGAEQGN